MIYGPPVIAALTIGVPDYLCLALMVLTNIVLSEDSATISLTTDNAQSQARMADFFVVLKAAIWFDNTKAVIKSIRPFWNV
jgi:hypothetical protein